MLQLAQGAGARQPEAPGNQLFLLMDGARMAARMFGSSRSSSRTNPAVQNAF